MSEESKLNNLTTHKPKRGFSPATLPQTLLPRFISHRQPIRVILHQLVIPGSLHLPVLPTYNPQKVFNSTLAKVLPDKREVVGEVVVGGRYSDRIRCID